MQGRTVGARVAQSKTMGWLRASIAAIGVCVAAIGVVAWLCECVGFAAIVNAFPGCHVGLGLAMAIYAATTIAGALSFLPGGLVVTEGAMTLLLLQSADHMDQATAIDATLLIRIATLWLGLVVGLGFLAGARAMIARRLGQRPSAVPTVGREP